MSRYQKMAKLFVAKWLIFEGFFSENSPVYSWKFMAGFRPNSKIIGNFRKIENIYVHFIKHLKWRLKIWVRRRVLEPRYRNLKSWNFRPGKQGFVFIVKTTKSYRSDAIFMKKKSIDSRVIVKIRFLEHKRF